MVMENTSAVIDTIALAIVLRIALAAAACPLKNHDACDPRLSSSQGRRKPARTAKRLITDGSTQNGRHTRSQRCTVGGSATGPTNRCTAAASPLSSELIRLILADARTGADAGKWRSSPRTGSGPPPGA